MRRFSDLVGHGRDAWTRVLLAGLTVLVGAGVTAMSLELVGRVRVETAFVLARGPYWTLMGIGGAGLGAIAWRLLPRRPTWWWALLLLGVLPGAWLGARVVVPMGLQLEYGTPTVACEGRGGLEVETCVGRDWSFMQGRLAYERMEGAMDRARCERFIAAVPDEPASALTDEGWVRCPYEDPTVWAATECEPAATPGRTHCFECGARSITSDDYRYIQAFDDSCTRATVIRVVNLPASAIDHCSRSVYEHDCLRRRAPAGARHTETRGALERRTPTRPQWAKTSCAPIAPRAPSPLSSSPP